MKPRFDGFGLQLHVNLSSESINGVSEMKALNPLGQFLPDTIIPFTKSEK